MKADAFRIADRERRKRRVVQPLADTANPATQGGRHQFRRAGKPGKVRAGGFPKETGLRDCFPVRRCGRRAALTNRNSPIRLSYDEIAIACGSIVETVERSSSCSQPRFPAAAKRFPVPVPDFVTLARAMPMKGLHELRSHASAEGRFLVFPDIFPVLRENRRGLRPRLRAKCELNQSVMRRSVVAGRRYRQSSRAQ